MPPELTSTDGVLGESETQGPSPKSRLLLSQWFAMAVVLVGITTIAGWIFDLPQLKSVLPGAVEMKANTALCLCVGAFALFVLGEPTSFRRQCLAQAMALAVSLLGFVTLFQYVFGWHLGIDEIFFQDDSDTFNPHPGRMSPFSAAVLGLFGLALMVLPYRSMRVIVFLIAALVALIGLIVVVGYLWGAAELVTDLWMPPVALNTAVAFMLLGAGALAAVGPPRLQRPVWRYAVPKSIEFTITASFVGALALLLSAGAYTYSLSSQFADSASSVAHTQQVRADLGHLYIAISDAESAQRNYLLTSDPEHRAAYIFLAGDVSRHVSDLSRLIADNSSQTRRLSDLRPVIEDRIELLDRHVEIFDREGLTAVREAISVDYGIRHMRNIRRTIDEMDRAELSLLVVRQQSLEQTRQRTLIALVATVIVAVFFFVMMLRTIIQQVAVRAKSEQELRIARDEAERANDAKDIFLATMSHEIRTPMNGVLGLVDVLITTTLSGYQRDLVETMQRSGRTLLALIDELLDFSKIEAGQMVLEAVPVDIASVVDGVCDSLSETARTKGVTLCRYVSPSLAQYVLSDETRLRQIVFNLVGNAVKFSAGRPGLRGRVMVRLEADSDNASHMVRLTVVDNGIGIATAAQKTLFRPFMQEETSTTRRYGGTGLGLAICRRLVSLMQGDIRLESIQGQGSTFTVRLPLAATGGASHIIPDLRGLRCILVQGDAFPASDMFDYLTHAGADVRYTGSLETAAYSACDLLPTVVIHDADGPVANVAVLRKLFAGIARVQHVALTRGHRRDPRRQCADIVTLDSDVLRRQSLLRAVAMAADRESSLVGNEIIQSRAWGSTTTAEELTSALRSSSRRSVTCVLLAPPPDVATELRAILESSGLTVYVLDNLSKALIHAKEVDGDVVVIHHAEAQISSLDRSPAALSNAETVGHVILSREGQSQFGLADPAWVTLDAGTIHPHELIRAVTIAAGRVIQRGTMTSDPSPPLEDTSRAGARNLGRRILIVEDDETNQKVILAQMKALGFVAEMANNGQEALHMWRAGRYALLLVDMHMPQLDGYGLTEQIRLEEQQGQRVPIIALTANALKDEPRRARAIGMDGYLTKPVSLTLLRATLEHWLPPATTPMNADVLFDPATRRTTTTLDVDVLRRLVGSNPDFINDFLRDFRDNARSCAAEAREASARGDLQTVCSAAHRLKSGARSVGALALGELCATIEHDAREGRVDPLGRAMARFEKELAAVDIEIERHIQGK